MNHNPVTDVISNLGDTNQAKKEDVKLAESHDKLFYELIVNIFQADFNGMAYFSEHLFSFYLTQKLMDGDKFPDNFYRPTQKWPDFSLICCITSAFKQV